VMRTVGEGLQARSWESLLEAIVLESGATLVSPIQHEEEILDEDKTQRVEAWVNELVTERKRQQAAAATGVADDQRPRKTARQSAATSDSFGEDALA
jgi:hypothetical protein